MNMAIEFRGVRFTPLSDLTVSAPSGAVIGIVGEKGAGKGALLRLASGAVQPEAGEVIAPGEKRYLAPLDALQLSPVDILLISRTIPAVTSSPVFLPLPVPTSPCPTLSGWESRRSQLQQIKFIQWISP